MFKAQVGITQKEIIILDPYWDEETIKVLRQQGRDDGLICPVCKQPVLVRAGEKKRWHFAHKDLTNCPLRHESPDVLQARVLLYSWLKSKLAEKVTVERHFDGVDLPRPIDCYVEFSNKQKIGYWILDRGFRDRRTLQYTLSRLGISIVWVPLTAMIRQDGEDQGTIHLTPTERDITFSSAYNQLYSPFDSSLSYLDVEDKRVMTLRGLKCVHSPQKYQFDFKLVTALDQMLFLSKTGELVHPGEHERLGELRKEVKEQERIRIIEEQNRHERERTRLKELAEQRKRMLTKVKIQPESADQDVTRSQVPSPKPSKNEKQESQSNNCLEKVYPCRICGTMTKNWTSLDLGSKTCICSRECLTRSHEVEA